MEKWVKTEEGSEFHTYNKKSWRYFFKERSGNGFQEDHGRCPQESATARSALKHRCYLPSKQMFPLGGSTLCDLAELWYGNVGKVSKMTY